MPIRWFLLFLALNGSAQTSTQSPEFKIHSDVELVLLDISVKNPKGGYVPGSRKISFKFTKTAYRRKSPSSPLQTSRSQSVSSWTTAAV
jgi:hypothetical protein